MDVLGHLVSLEFMVHQWVSQEVTVQPRLSWPEVIHIQMTSAEECFNRDLGLELPGCWMAALRSQEARNI